MIEKDLPELPCRELVEVITDYLEDRLSPVDRARFEAHLAECEACRTYLEQFRQTIRALGRVPEESLSSEARGALLDEAAAASALRSGRLGGVAVDVLADEHGDRAWQHSPLVTAARDGASGQ